MSVDVGVLRLRRHQRLGVDGIFGSEAEGLHLDEGEGNDQVIS